MHGTGGNNGKNVLIYKSSHDKGCPKPLGEIEQNGTGGLPIAWCTSGVMTGKGKAWLESRSKREIMMERREGGCPGEVGEVNPGSHTRGQ